MLCPLQWHVLPQESFPTSTAQVMGLCYRSHSRSQCPEEEFIHSPFPSRRPWRITSRTLSNKATFVHQPPLLPLVFVLFWWQKRVEACGLVLILNNITIKFQYRPLVLAKCPLFPAALEPLCGSTIFTKLDLRSSYNLIKICEGNE